MLKTRDGKLQIELIKNLGDAPIRPADWSIVNLPTDSEEAGKFFKNLNNSPNENHVSLVLCRHNKKKRIDALINLTLANEYLAYLETVSIAYDKPSSCSNNGLLPVSEVGYLFYKGAHPDVKNTAWFRDGMANATNLWDVSPRTDEPVTKTYFKKFSWELQVLMFCLCGKPGYRSFIYATPISGVDEAQLIHNFCEKYDVSCTLYIDDDVQFAKLSEWVKK